jgi:glutathione S-transferase
MIRIFGDLWRITKAMGDKAFLASDEMTIADCYLFWVLMHAPKSGVELPDRLRNCFDRMKVRPSVIQAFAEEGLV